MDLSADDIGFAILAGALGGSVGVAEILARYRDEPRAACFSLPGILYMLGNALASILAYLVLIEYGEHILPGVADDQLASAIVGGFGAMVIARSKLLTIPTPGGGEAAVGPDQVVTSVLSTLDRAIDRERSTDRQKRVFTKVQELDRDVLDAHWDAVLGFLKVSIASFQNLSPLGREQLDSTISQVVEPADPHLRLMAIGFAFIDIAGEAKFDQIIDQLGVYLSRLLAADGDPHTPEIGG